MPQKTPLSDLELAAFEAGQDFEALLIQSAREMGAGRRRGHRNQVFREVVGPTIAGSRV